MGLDQDLKELKSLNTLSNVEKQLLLKRLNKIKLLTPDFANTKTAKNIQFSQYQSYIMHLSPAETAYKALSRIGTLCPMASLGCKAACLNTAGRGRFNKIQESRLRKSLYYILFKKEFMIHLSKEIFKLNSKAIKIGKQLVIRLNGTSDIMWESIKIGQDNIFELFPNVQFYDYTAIPKHALNSLNIPNYYIIFSAKENNEQACLDMTRYGINVAMVFDTIPKTYKKLNVINGDEHDFRFLDKAKGAIVGLKAKGKAKQDISGFVRILNKKTKVLNKDADKAS